MKVQACIVGSFARLRACGLLRAGRIPAAHRPGPRLGPVPWSPAEAYFWRTHTGAELDLLLLKAGRRLGMEVKRADAPTLAPSMRIALADLKLDHLTVLYPGERSYALADRVTVVPFATVAAGDINVLFPRRRKKSS